MGIPTNIKDTNPFRNIQMDRSVESRSPSANQGGSAPDINEIVGSNKGHYNKRAQKKNEFGKNDFLNLLSQQIKNQDPTKPMDQNKFVADLAQFSQLEQLTNINQAMEQKEQAQILNQKVTAANFLGKKITTSGNSIYYNGDGTKSKIHFSLPRFSKLLW